jgi:hypothetical protein
VSSSSGHDLGQLRDQVTCGQCGDRFSLADLSRFLHHKMTGHCRRRPYSPLSSPAEVAADSHNSVWQQQQQQEQKRRPQSQKRQAESPMSDEGILLA